MIRKGECNNCGWCCEFIAIERNIITEQQSLIPDVEYFYTLRGGVKCNDGKIRFTSYSFIPCNNYDSVLGRCIKYNERPDVCKLFPFIPEQIEGTPCSFWFECKEGNRGGLRSLYPTPSRGE